MKTSLNVFIVLFVAGLLTGCESGGPDAVPTIDASTLDMERQDIPEPGTPWGRPTPVNGKYCCVCQTSSGQDSYQLNSIGPALDVCDACAIVCDNEGAVVDGTRSHGGDC